MSQPPDNWHLGSPTLVCPVVAEGAGGFSWLPNLKVRKKSRFYAAKKTSIFSQKSSTLILSVLQDEEFQVCNRTFIKVLISQNPTDNIFMHRHIRCFRKNYFLRTTTKSPKLYKVKTK